jgi:hypothetical protein
VASACVGLATMGLYTILENTYVNYPRTPDQQLARVVPHNVKSITVYVIEYQSAVLQWIVWILVVSSILVLINLILNQIWPPGSRE